MPQRVDLIKEAKFHTHKLILWPARWQAYKCRASLRWQVFPFDESIANQIPDQPGVYAFCIQPNVADLDASYVMYIGKTERSLRTRFREYLREAQSPSGRPRLTDMLLNPYRSFLYFICAVLNPQTIPGEIEEDLLDTFMPPMNTELPAEVRQIVNAFS
jgi:excinuclease UvrABC nuclease subunit